MSPKEFQDFTKKLNDKGLTFNNQGGNNVGISNAAPPAAGETVKKEVDETMSAGELRKLSDQLEKTDADIDLKSVGMVPKKEEQATTAAQVGSLTNDEALRMVLQKLMAQN